jgi:DNA mismatch repair protein MutS
VHVEAVEHGDNLVFLHGIKDGPANQSYGLQVAALAGVPKNVIAAARRYLAELERERDALRNSVSTQPQLPLFTPPRAESRELVRPAVRSPVLAALRAVDPNGLSPREALDLVFRLRELDSGRE